MQEEPAGDPLPTRERGIPSCREIMPGSILSQIEVSIGSIIYSLVPFPLVGKG